MASLSKQTKRQMLWLLAILLFLFPAYTALFSELVNMIFKNGVGRLDFGRMNLGMRMTLFYYTWYFLLLILLPYALLCVYTSVGKWHIALKLLLFYVMLLVTGLLLGQWSVAGLYTGNPYPRVLLLYLLLTLTIGVLVDMSMRKIVRQRSEAME